MAGETDDIWGLLARGELRVDSSTPDDTMLLAVQQYIAHTRYGAREPTSPSSPTSPTSSTHSSLPCSSPLPLLPPPLTPRSTTSEFMAHGQVLAESPGPITGLEAVALATYLTLNLDSVLRVPVFIDATTATTSATSSSSVVSRKRARSGGARLRTRGLLVQSPSGGWGLLGTTPEDDVLNLTKPAVYTGMKEVLAEWALEIEALPGKGLCVHRIGVGAPLPHVWDAPSPMCWTKVVVDVRSVGWPSAGVALDNYESKLTLMALNVPINRKRGERMDPITRASILNGWGTPILSSSSSSSSLPKKEKEKRVRGLGGGGGEQQQEYGFVPRGSPAFCRAVSMGHKDVHMEAIARHERVHDTAQSKSDGFGSDPELQAAYEWAQSQLEDLGTLYSRPSDMNAALFDLAKGKENEKTLVKQLTTQASLEAIRASTKAIRASASVGVGPSAPLGSDAKHFSHLKVGQRAQLALLHSDLRMAQKETNPLVAVTRTALESFGNSVPGIPNAFNLAQAREFDTQSLRFQPHELTSKVRLTDFAHKQ